MVCFIVTYDEWGPENCGTVRIRFLQMTIRFWQFFGILAWIMRIEPVETGQISEYLQQLGWDLHHDQVEPGRFGGIHHNIAIPTNKRVIVAGGCDDTRVRFPGRNRR